MDKHSKLNSAVLKISELTGRMSNQKLVIDEYKSDERELKKTLAASEARKWELSKENIELSKENVELSKENAELKAMLKEMVKNQ